MCGSDEPAEFKCQHTLGSGVNAVWIVNSTAYGYGYRDFPDLMNHAVTSTHNGTLLSLESITLKQNNTAYQCQLEVYHHKTPCTYQSNVGRLILRGCGGKKYSNF